MPKSDKVFLVEWQVDVWADTPLEAAREALKIMRDPKSTATCFRVMSSDGCDENIDLELEGETEDDAESPQGCT